MDISFLLLLSVLCSFVSAFPERAGTCSATDEQGIENGMGGKSQDLGFTISADKTTVAPGESVKVTLSGPRTFKGLLFYAIDEKKTRYAGWSELPGGFQFLDTQCSTFPAKSTISHSDANPKANLTLTWTAPSQALGDVKFAGVMVSARTEWQILSAFTVKGASNSSSVEIDEPNAPAESNLTSNAFANDTLPLAVNASDSSSIENALKNDTLPSTLAPSDTQPQNATSTIETSKESATATPSSVSPVRRPTQSRKSSLRKQRFLCSKIERQPQRVPRSLLPQLGAECENQRRLMRRFEDRVSRSMMNILLNERSVTIFF
jgi:hypothetical protein